MSAPNPSAPKELSPAVRAHLKKLAHPLKPVVQIGGQGVTDGVVVALDQALKDHELVKVKVAQSFEEDKQATAEELARRTDASVCQVMGRVLTLFRAHPPHARKKTSIELPK